MTEIKCLDSNSQQDASGREVCVKYCPNKDLNTVLTRDTSVRYSISVKLELRMKLGSMSIKLSMTTEGFCLSALPSKMAQTNCLNTIAGGIL